MKKIHIEFSDERLITPSGLVFVGQILGKSSFVKKINRAPISKDYLQKQIKNGDMLREMHIEPTALDNGFVPVDIDVTPFDYIGQTFRDVTYSPSDNEEKTVGIRTIYEITERTIDRYGQYFIVPDTELGTYWTNTSLPDETVIDLYHAHGESEQHHSEIKTDMDVERLPSGKFESNKLVLELTMIAYNILRIIGQELLEIYFQASL